MNITSGADINVVGGNIKAAQVTATVGGNLNIESLQDTATYAEKNQQVGASGTVGAGHKIDSNYASVKEQSALEA